MNTISSLYAFVVLNSSNTSTKDLLFAYQCLNSIKDIDFIKCFFGADFLYNGSENN